MNAFTKQLFDGFPSPSEKIIPQDPEYGPLWAKIEADMAYFTQKLPPEDAQRLEQMEFRYSDAICMNAYAGFAYGLRLGMGLVWEALH